MTRPFKLHEHVEANPPDFRSVSLVRMERLEQDVLAEDARAGVMDARARAAVAPDY